jgi:perosamine synthetase
VSEAAKQYRVAMSAPDIRDEDVAAVVYALRSGTLSKGPYTAAFEQAFAQYIGARHAVAVSNGTAALHLCLRAAGIGDGDEVITTPFGYVASANAILYCGATPVFVDIDEETMNIDPALAASAVTDHTRALLPVHVFGQACAMDELIELSASRGLRLIEDACEAIGSEYRGRRLGSFGGTAAFSFFPNKQMTTGEGAMITCADPDTASLLRVLRNQGLREGSADLVHEELGYNYRMTELSAALGFSQLARIEEMLALREAVADRYRARIEGMSGLRLIEAAAGTSRLSWFTAVVRLDPRFDRSRVIEALAARGVPAKAYFEPIHLQPVYRRRFGFAPGDFPITERVGRSTLAIPFHNRLSRDDIDIVCDALEQVLEQPTA